MRLPPWQCHKVDRGVAKQQLKKTHTHTRTLWHSDVINVVSEAESNRVFAAIVFVEMEEELIWLCEILHIHRVTSCLMWAFQMQQYVIFSLQSSTRRFIEQIQSFNRWVFKNHFLHISSLLATPFLFFIGFILNLQKSDTQCFFVFLVWILSYDREKYFRLQTFFAIKYFSFFFFFIFFFVKIAKPCWKKSPPLCQHPPRGWLARWGSVAGSTAPPSTKRGRWVTLYH